MMSEICERCGRPIQRWAEEYEGPLSKDGCLVIGHGYYGCDTGCCGLEAVYRGPPNTTIGWRSEFDFTHDEEDFVARIAHLHPGIPIVLTHWHCHELDYDSPHPSVV